MKRWMQIIKGIYYNLQMRSKVALLCVFAILASTIMVGIITYRATSNIIEKKVVITYSETMTQTGNFLNEKLNNMLLQCLWMITLN